METPKKKQWEKFAIRRLMERPLYIFYPFKSFVDRILGRNSYFERNDKHEDTRCIPFI